MLALRCRAGGHGAYPLGAAQGVTVMATHAQRRGGFYTSGRSPRNTGVPYTVHTPAGTPFGYTQQVAGSNGTMWAVYPGGVGAQAAQATVVGTYTKADLAISQRALQAAIAWAVGTYTNADATQAAHAQATALLLALANCKHAAQYVAQAAQAANVALPSA